MGSKHWKKTLFKRLSEAHRGLGFASVAPRLSNDEKNNISQSRNFWKSKAEKNHGIWHFIKRFMAFHGISWHELTGHFAPVSDGSLTVDVAGQGTGAQRWNSNTRFYGFEIDFVFFLQTSPARNGKLDGKGGGNKGIDGWEETVMGSGVSSVRFIWRGAVLWRYGDTYVKKSR